MSTIIGKKKGEEPEMRAEPEPHWADELSVIKSSLDSCTQTRTTIFPPETVRRQGPELRQAHSQRGPVTAHICKANILQTFQASNFLY